MIEIMRSRIQPDKLRFFQMVPLLSLRNRVKAPSVAACPHQKESDEVVLASDQDAPWMSPASWAHPTFKRTRERLRTLEELYIPSGLVIHWDAPELAGRCHCGKECLAFRPGLIDLILDKWKTMDGLINVKF